MSIDPRTPVVVGVAQRNGREVGSEPVAMMVDAAEGALADAGCDIRSKLAAVHVIRGIWPYRNPGRLVADRLGLGDATTGLTQLGGNGVLDLVNELAADIAAGHLDAALVCAAETMRTRRKDKAEGRTSTYLDEADNTAPDAIFGSDRELADAVDFYAGTHEPVNFYALSETALRHRRGESPAHHRDRIAALWARASEIAAENPDAWFTTAKTPADIATPGPVNRMVAAPYPKLMTSNINVDQGAAVIICAAGTATAAGVSADRMVAVRSGAGAHDHWVTRTRWALDESPALRIAGRRSLELAGLAVDDVPLLDLYSCFPAAVQVAQHELNIDAERDFTITGGLTFAGGPYNSYCMHPLARAVELIRDGASSALLTGNGGFYTKHSFTVLGADPAPMGFRFERPQAEVDALLRRPEAERPAAAGVIEAYTVAFASTGRPERGIVSVLADDGSRTWTNTQGPDTMQELLDTDCCGRTVTVSPPEPEAASEVHLT